MNTISYKTARAGDSVAMAKLHALCFDSPWSEQSFTRFIDDPACQGIIAWEAEQGAGFILCRGAAGEREILTFCVLPAFRRRGIGRGLLEKAAQQAKEQGAEVLFLEVNNRNPAALWLYESTGFMPIGERKSYYPAQTGQKPQDALVMRLILT